MKRVTTYVVHVNEPYDSSDVLDAKLSLKGARRVAQEYIKDNYDVENWHEVTKNVWQEKDLGDQVACVSITIEKFTCEVPWQVLDRLRCI